MWSNFARSSQLAETDCRRKKPAFWGEAWSCMRWAKPPSAIRKRGWVFRIADGFLLVEARRWIESRIDLRLLHCEIDRDNRKARNRSRTRNGSVLWRLRSGLFVDDERKTAARVVDPECLSWCEAPGVRHSRIDLEWLDRSIGGDDVVLDKCCGCLSDGCQRRNESQGRDCKA